RRCGLRVDVADDAAREATAQLARLDLDRQHITMPDRRRRERRLLQRRAGQRRDFARDAIDAQAMTEVRGELQRQQRVVEQQVLADVLPDWGLGIEDQQAAVIVGQLQLARRAQHALALDATQL